MSRLLLGFGLGALLPGFWLPAPSWVPVLGLAAIVLGIASWRERP